MVTEMIVNLNVESVRDCMWRVEISLVRIILVSNVCYSRRSKLPDHVFLFSFLRGTDRETQTVWWPRRRKFLIPVAG